MASLVIEINNQNINDWVTSHILEMLAKVLMVHVILIMYISVYGKAVYLHAVV